MMRQPGKAGPDVCGNLCRQEQIPLGRQGIRLRRCGRLV